MLNSVFRMENIIRKEKKTENGKHIQNQVGEK